MEVAEYMVSGLHRLIVVPEGHQGQGWKIFTTELGKVVALFNFSPGSNFVMLPFNNVGTLVVLRQP